MPKYSVLAGFSRHYQYYAIIDAIDEDDAYAKGLLIDGDTDGVDASDWDDDMTIKEIEKVSAQ